MNDEKWEIRAKLEAILLLVALAFAFVYFGVMCEYEDLTGQNVEIVKEEAR